MQEERFDGQLGRSIVIDICHACQSFWFDARESVALTPGSTLALFRIIGEKLTRPNYANAELARCPRCKGRGTIIKDPCPKCAGHGRVRATKRLSVKVPAGVDTGDRIRLAGEGEAGRNGGPPGDLYVEIAVREHPIFERDGAHLSCEVPVSFTTAALGGTIQVPTLDGQAAVKVPAGTQSGRVFRLRDKGIRPVRGGATGDLFCRVVVETPVELNAQQKELLRRFETSLAADGKSHNPRQSSWFEGVRQFFTRSGD